MKAKCAALLVSMLLLGVTRAGAASITYAVSEFFDDGLTGIEIGGSITTDGTLGPLDNNNIVGWDLVAATTFRGTTAAFFNLTAGTNGSEVSVKNLTATANALTLGTASGAIIPNGQAFFTFCPALGCETASSLNIIEFDAVEPLGGPPGTQYEVCSVDCISEFDPSLTFADGKVIPESVTATPLPAALPLFATGIGGLGLLGWRRKRKAQAI